MKWITYVMVLPFFLSCNPIIKLNEPETKSWTTKSEVFSIHNDKIDDDQAVQINYWLVRGAEELAGFFGKKFKNKFDIYLFSDRDSLNRQWQKDWNMPGFKSQCWMVASGVGHRLDILSPRIWETQACEHDPKDTLATRKIILHEMVHVFHGQYQPSPTFENIENIDWLIEGLAVYVSGQLDEARLADTKQIIHDTGGPSNLDDFWKGANRYGLAGSMMQFIDHQFGREKLVDLLKVTTANEVFDHLGIMEEGLISNWKAFVIE